MNKLFLFLVAIIGVSCCSTSNTTVNTSLKEQDFQIENATFQYWVAGVNGGGAGYSFNLSLTKELPKNSKLVKVVFRKKSAPFVQVDALHYNANLIVRTGGGKQDSQTPNVDSNLNDSQAQLFYSINGKEMSRIIDNVKEIPSLAYPSAKPRTN